MYPFTENDNIDQDFPNYLKKRSIFDSPDVVSPSNWYSGKLDFGSPSGREEASPSLTNLGNRDFGDIYKQITQAEAGPANQRYRAFLESNLPTKEQYRPSKTQALASILAGVSEGLGRGGFSGYSAAQSVLDEPYRTALENYKLQSERLGTAASLEERENLNKVKTFWDIIRNQQQQSETERKAKVDEAIINYRKAQARNLQGPQPFGSSFLNTLTGNRQITIKDPNAIGGVRILDLGQAGPTQQERINEFGRRAGAAFGATMPFRKQLIEAAGEQARKTAGTRIAGQKEILEWKNEHPGFTLTADKDGIVYGVNKIDPTDIRATGLEKLTPEAAIELRKKAAIEIKQTAAPATTTTRTQELTKEGKVRTVTTKESTKPKVLMQSPDGKQYRVSEEEVKDAEKNGWKRVG